MVPWQKCITVCFCKKLKGFSSKFKIPEGVNAAAGNPSSTSAQANNNRICGREFTTAAESVPRTICSKLNFFLNYIMLYVINLKEYLNPIYLTID